MARIRHRKDAWAVFAFLIVVQIICLRGSQRLQHSLAPQSVSRPAQTWLKRDEPPLLQPLKHTTTSTLHSPTPTSQPTPDPDHPTTPACQPIPLDHSPKHICNHVIQHCSSSGHFDYLRFYYCAGVARHDTDHDEPSHPSPPSTHPSPRIGMSALRFLRLLCILLWMLFLFSWVGVVASDFFCPNLSTIASRLGLNESTAGVTFLAFGNGSPDVFSTFGAMKSDSGSLAIGELIGAASFIVSVISGSMMLIAPFKVKPWPFCRDVGFFTVAVALTLAFLFDGKLRRIETIALIALYLLYATTVIVGAWWQERTRRQKRRLAAAREEFDSQLDHASVRSRASSLSAQSTIHERDRSRLLAPPSLDSSQRMPSPSEYDPDFDPFENWASQRAARSGASSPDASRPASRAPSIHTPGSTASRSVTKPSLSIRPNLVPRHSLLSAIEFRDVVQSLRREANADRSQEIFQSWDPERFLAAHHHHHQHQHQHQHQHTNSLLTRSTSGEAHPSNAAFNQNRHRHNRVLSLGPGVGSSAGLARSASTGSERRRLTFGAHDSVQPASAQTDTTATTSVDAANVEDPWREHLPGDACEPLISPALPLDDATQAQPHHDDLRKSLPKLQIPQWDTKAARSQEARRVQASRQRTDATSTGTASKYRADALPSQRRIRPERSAGGLVAWKVRVILNALFPSLRHLHSKSLLGAFVSIATSPAILLLNLTLPVVDDDAERAERECDTAEADGIGAVRLEGDEADLQAAAANEDAEDSVTSPSSHTAAWSAEERVEAEEDAERQANTQRDREIASALRHLPSLGGSPLSLGSGPESGSTLRFPSAQSPMPVDSQTPYAGSAGGSDAASFTSCTSNASCEAEDQEMRRSIRRFLILCQCVWAPTFVTWAIVSSSGSPRLGLKVGIAAVAGAIIAGLTFMAMRRKDAGHARYSDRTLSTFGMIRCSMGFVVSVMWIMSIVDEVVSILQTVGIIVGLSDAILGLTVFAVGNSLGDLVANVTIARLGHPVMAISACFAGPMLNLLLGIGISGTYLLSSSGHKGKWSHDGAPGIYPIDFNPTLLVSGLGLLFILVGTLIAVPMNNFHLTRPIGLALIGAYVLIMTLNLLTEVFWARGHSVS
ncbi:sodium/calcium exchanger protein [Moesziomyces antarcticus]|uniref:Sodium/calcium exchanger protein n=1 Tax=Pseudozyma antarctica TaxID=84753 RepID=A0A081CNQ9_PSEA2|nr:sodium/calcium exchanger protein [Moesziomyces antarcticus]GAK68305.1 sodium/calcium exchanger protein [Moesziomyces antarcticus]